MKILINATILSERNTGLGVYTYEALKYVCPLLIEKNISFDIACKKIDFLPEGCKNYGIEVCFSNFFKRKKVMDKLSNKYEYVWSTTQHGVKNKKCKQIITIHDLTPLIYPKGRLHQYAYYKFILPKMIKKSTFVITVSNNTKKDILKYYKVREDKVKVVYENIKNIDFNFIDFSKIEDKFKIKEKQYLCITGIHYPYKNIHAIINAYHSNKELLSTKIVVIGNDNCKYGEYLKKLIRKYKLEEYFIFTGFVSNEEKNTLLKQSLAALYPSKYEGFGLPVLEAMNLGVPVITSNISSLPEICGDAALYFNPDSIEDIAFKILMIVKNENLRTELIQKGISNCLRFSWEKAAREILELLSSLK